MRAEGYILLSALCYVVVNIIISRHFASCSPLANAVFLFTVSALVLTPLALLQQYVDPNFRWPPVNKIGHMVLVGVTIAAADYLYLKAYQAGGSLMMILSVLALTPVFATAINLVTGGDWPSVKQFCGYCLVPVVVLLIVDKKPDPDREPCENPAVVAEATLEPIE